MSTTDAEWNRDDDSDDEEPKEWNRDDSSDDEEPEEQSEKSRELRGLESEFLGSAKGLPSLRSKSNKKRSERIAVLKSEQGLRVRGAEDFDRTAPVVRKQRDGMWNERSKPKEYLAGTLDAVRAAMPTKQDKGQPRLYKCPGCKKRAPHWITKDEVTIDHVTNWRDWIFATAKPEKDGKISNASVLVAYSDLSNLAGMCGPCNSSKNGPKGKYG